MNDIELKLDEAGRGAFVIESPARRVAEMRIAVDDENLTVYHTQVDDALKGQGIASKLLAEMVTYARNRQLKVIPLCPYVLAQFRRHPDQYADIWNKTWHG